MKRVQTNFAANTPQHGNIQSRSLIPSPHDEGVGRGLGRGAARKNMRAFYETPLSLALSPRFATGRGRRLAPVRSINIHPFVICLHLILGLFLLTGCRRDMFQQPRNNPLSSSDFFEDGAGSRSLVPHTLARGHLNEDEQFYTGKIGTNLVTTFPFPITRAVLERGRERFNIDCALCHGNAGDGRGMIPQRGFPAPPSYHIDRLRQAPVGHFFDVISHGYGVMYSQASRVEPADRWAIAAYIRALQLSQDARVSDLSAEERAKLESQTP
jgi:hypothetical protein